MVLVLCSPKPKMKVLQEAGILGEPARRCQTQNTATHAGRSAFPQGSSGWAMQTQLKRGSQTHGRVVTQQVSRVLT